jgi:hypothetical protein
MEAEQIRLPLLLFDTCVYTYSLFFSAETGAFQHGQALHMIFVVFG